ncbi:MAG TPA: response regulator [Anaerolineae bacterium]|nr:response regulator [Anaerolineae bacterium]
MRERLTSFQPGWGAVLLSSALALLLLYSGALPVGLYLLILPAVLGGLQGRRRVWLTALILFALAVLAVWRTPTLWLHWAVAAFLAGAGATLASAWQAQARRTQAAEQEVARRVASEAALRRITQEIASTLELGRILQLVLEEARRFTHADAGMIWLWRDELPTLALAQGYTETTSAAYEELLAHAETDPSLVAFMRQPVTRYIPNLAELHPTPAYQAGMQTELWSPVFYEDRLAAAIVLHCRQPQALNPAAIDFMDGLAAETALAVGNDRRYQEQLLRGNFVRERAEQMRLLLEATRTMRSDRPLEETLLDMAYATQEAVGYEIVLISVIEGQMVRRVAGAGMPLADLERLKQVRRPWLQIARLLQEQFRIGNCYYIPAEQQHVWRGELDVFEAEVALPEARRPGMWHPQDLLLVPLYGPQGDAVGYLSVDEPLDGRAPTRTSLEVLELFAAQIGVVIANNRLVENLRLQLNTLMLLNELSRSITTKLDLSLVLNTVVQAVTNLLGYDYATVYLQARGQTALTPRASSGYDLSLLGEGLQVEPGVGLVGAVVESGMPLALDDMRSEPRFTPGPLPVGSALLVPLQVAGRTVGVLSAERREAGVIEPLQVATLTMLADQISVAVENAQLFEEVKNFSAELERRVEERTAELAEALNSLRTERDRSTILYEIASGLVASLDIDRVLHKTVSMLKDAVGAERATVLLLDQNTGYLQQRASVGGGKSVPPGGVRAPYKRNEGLVGWVLTNRQSAMVPDVRLDARWIPIEDDTRSVLAVPITAGDETVGVIFLHSPEVDAFDIGDQRLVEAAAVQVGHALNNAELYRLIREQAERVGSMLRAQQNEAARSQAILEGIADGVLVADARGKIILFNAAAERILTLNRAQAVGRSLSEVLGFYGDKVRGWLEQIAVWEAEPGSYQSGDFLSERLELGRQVVSMHLSPVISPIREFLGIVAAFRDITAEVEADRAKSEFVSTVSHELRTPMTSVKGYVDLLLMGATGPLTDIQVQFLNIIRNNTDRLTSLVNDLLDMSRIEGGKVELHCQPVDMAELIRQVAVTLTPKIEEKGLQLRTVLPEGLPLAYGDPDRMVQILTNLVANAFKYTPMGGEIAIYAYVREEMFHVAVADTGIGISPEDQSRIFSRFYRVDNPLVLEAGGTGLGLAITVSLVQMHGGQIAVESELGEGSIFTVTFPLAEGEATVPVGRPPAGLRANAVATVLVVEDDPEVAEMLRLTLEHEGHRVVVAASGEAALRLARQEQPDLISLDIRLPDLDGFEVLQLLKRNPETASIPVVIVSVVFDQDRGLRLGAVDYFTKPVDETRLLQVVKRVLTGKGTVLVVDDDRDTLTLLRTALRRQGLQVRTVTRGERALRMAQEQPPSLILLDLKLPGMDGYEVLQQLKRHPATANIPVVVMTGFAEPGNGSASAMKALGATRFVTKPFSMEELGEEISRLVEGADGNKE